jgi:hypothetical protein
MRPPSSAEATPAPAVSRMPIVCLPGRIARASAPITSPISAHQSSLNTSPTTSQAIRKRTTTAARAIRTTGTGRS